MNNSNTERMDGITIDGGDINRPTCSCYYFSKKHMNNSNTERMDGITIDGGILLGLLVVITISQKNT